MPSSATVSDALELAAALQAEAVDTIELLGGNYHLADAPSLRPNSSVNYYSYGGNEPGGAEEYSWLVVTRSLTLRAKAGEAAPPVLDGGGIYRVLYVAGPINFVLKGIHLQNGRTSRPADNPKGQGGAGIRIDGGSTVCSSLPCLRRARPPDPPRPGCPQVSLLQCVVANNTAAGAKNVGGGIHIRSGVLYMSESLVTQNSAERFGGGIFAGGGTLAMYDSTVHTPHPHPPARDLRTRAHMRIPASAQVSFNSAGEGGAVYLPDPSAIVVLAGRCPSTLRIPHLTPPLVIPPAVPHAF